MTVIPRRKQITLYRDSPVPILPSTTRFRFKGVPKQLKEDILTFRAEYAMVGYGCIVLGEEITSESIYDE